MRTLFILATSLALATAVPAQSCGTLAIGGSGAPGTVLQIELTDATPEGFAILYVGEHTGSTTFSLGVVSLTVGLDGPFFAVPIGFTDAGGDASLPVMLPPVLPHQLDLNAQAATFSLSGLPFGITACTSNVVAFTIG